MKIDRVKLISEMARKRISSIELADKACVSRASVSALRNGKSCNANTVKHVAAALGLDVAELLEEAGA